MTGKFSNQGDIIPAGTILHTCPLNNITEITYMRFNNSVNNYIIDVYKYDSSISTNINLYRKSLTLGDTITDSMLYVLNPGDYIYVECSVSDTTYIITGQDMPNINMIR
jgi:hypothetical protein